MNKVDREKELEKRRDADKKIVAELYKVGIQVNSVFDLVNTNQPYPQAIPVLINLLQEDFDSDWMREGIVRALTVREAKGIANKVLLELYHSLPKDKISIRWAIGNAMPILAIKDNVQDILNIVKNKKNGISRQMFAWSLGNFKDNEEVENTLIELLDDEEIAPHVLHALGMLKSKKSVDKVKQLLNHKKTLIRKNALKALKKIDSGNRI